MVPFISSRPGSEPGTMSRGIWSSRVMYLASWSRNGMYSPNGTGWVLEYLCPGPVPGRHTMPWLRTSVGSSPSTMAPTSTGTPTASTASWMSALTVGSVNGSMSVEFSGQITMSGAGASPDSTDIDPFTDPTVNADIQEAVDAVGVPVLVGAIVDGEEPTDVLNQGIVWRPGTGPGQRYSKTHPVPFGEYIPFRDQLARYITRLDQIPRDMVPGSEPGLLEMNGTIVGDVICFEVAYDALVRDVVRGGAEVLVVQTNNATYMGTGQIEQQFAISRLRAIESGRYLVVAATNGVSGIISPRGKVVERAPTRTQAVLTHTLQPATGITAGIRFGVWIEMSVSLLATVGLALGVATGFRRRRDHAKGPSPEKHYVDA